MTYADVCPATRDLCRPARSEEDCSSCGRPRGLWMSGTCAAGRDDTDQSSYTYSSFPFAAFSSSFRGSPNTAFISFTSAPALPAAAAAAVHDVHNRTNTDRATPRLKATGLDATGPSKSSPRELMSDDRIYTGVAVTVHVYAIT